MCACRFELGGTWTDNYGNAVTISNEVFQSYSQHTFVFIDADAQFAVAEVGRACVCVSTRV